MRHSKFSNIPGGIQLKMSKTVPDSYSGNQENHNSSNGSSQIRKSYFNVQKSAIMKNALKTQVQNANSSQQNARQNSQQNSMRKLSAKSKLSNQSAKKPLKMNKGINAGVKVQQKTLQSRCSSRSRNSKSPNRSQQEAAIHSYFATTRQMHLNLRNPTQNCALVDSSNSRSPGSINSLQKGVQGLSAAGKAPQEKKAKIKVSRNHPQIYKEAAGRKRSIISKQIDLSSGAGAASLDSQDKPSQRKAHQQNLNALLSRINQKELYNTVKTSYYRSALGKTAPAGNQSNISSRMETQRKPQPSPRKAPMAGPISKTLTALSSATAMKTVPKTTKNATSKPITIPGKTIITQKAQKSPTQYQKSISQSDKTKKVLKKKTSLNVNPSINSKKFGIEKASPSSAGMVAWNSTMNPLKQQKANKMLSSKKCAPEPSNTLSTPGTRPTRASSSYGQTNEIHFKADSRPKHDISKMAIYNSTHDDKEALRTSTQPNHVVFKVAEKQPLTEHELQQLNEVQSSSDQEIPSENDLPLHIDPQQFAQIQKCQHQSQIPTFIPYLETTSSMKNTNRIQNDIYIWYAAYDEDMNFQQFTKRLKQKPAKILSSILIGQEVCFDLDISKHPYIRQSDEKDHVQHNQKNRSHVSEATLQQTAYAMVKLYMVRKSQLIEIAKHKNDGQDPRKLDVDIINEHYMRIQYKSSGKDKQQVPQQYLDYNSIQQVSTFLNVPVFVITNQDEGMKLEVSRTLGQRYNINHHSIHSDNQIRMNGEKQNEKAIQISKSQIINAIKKRQNLMEKNVVQFEKEHKEILDNMLVGLKQSFTKNYNVPYQALSNYVGQIRGVRAKIHAAAAGAPALEQWNCQHPSMVCQQRKANPPSLPQMRAQQAPLGLHKSEIRNADNSNCCCDLNFFSEYFRIEQKSIPLSGLTNMRSFSRREFDAMGVSRGQLHHNMHQFQEMVAARLSQTKMAAQVGADKRYTGTSDLRPPTDGTSARHGSQNKSEVYKGNQKMIGDDVYRSVQIENVESSSGINFLRKSNGGLPSTQKINAEMGFPNQGPSSTMSRNRRQDHQLAPSYTTGNKVTEVALSDLGDSLVDEQMMKTQFKNDKSIDQISQQSKYLNSSDQNAQIHIFKRMNDNEIHPNQDSMSNTQQEEHQVEAEEQDDLALSLKSLNSLTNPDSPKVHKGFTDNLNIYGSGEAKEHEPFFENNPSSQRNLADYFKDILVLTSTHKNGVQDSNGKLNNQFQDDVNINAFFDQINLDSHQTEGIEGEPGALFQSTQGQNAQRQQKAGNLEELLRCPEQIQSVNNNDPKKKKATQKIVKNSQSLISKNSINLRQSTNSKLQQMNTSSQSPKQKYSRNSYLKKQAGAFTTSGRCGGPSNQTFELKVTDSSKTKTYIYGSGYGKPQ